MTDTTNRVLSLAEVMALEEGRAVYTEERDGTVVESKVRTRRGSLLVGADGRYYDIDCHNWDLDVAWERIDVRVWSLPQPPTHEEMEKWPWEVRE
jgi:hypothetical protein